jgi:hypothetical protein
VSDARTRVCSRLGDVAQQAVARAVAAGVVDHLELVEVDVQQHVFALRRAARRSTAVSSRVVEFPAVDEPVSASWLAWYGQRAFQAPFLGDVSRTR